jgi:hypothetical protein
MCFSATVSFSSAAVLVSTGMYAVRQARHLSRPYQMWALIPVFFGLQQAFEGLVWQGIIAGNSDEVRSCALGFHFFSHFLWLWWFPLCSYLVEPGKIRKIIFGICALSGAFAGALVYSSMLFHSEWLSVTVRRFSILYEFSVPFKGPIHLPITPAALYGLIVLVPLIFSSRMLIRIFGVLVVLSVVLASVTYSYAYISVWCFFVAILSLYLVYMIHRLVAAGGVHKTIFSNNS